MALSGFVLDWRGQRQPDGGNRDDWVIANDRAIRTTTASKPPIAPSQYATYSSSVAEPKRLLKSHSDHKSGTVAKSSGQVNMISILGKT